MGDHGRRGTKVLISPPALHWHSTGTALDYIALEKMSSNYKWLGRRCGVEHYCTGLQWTAMDWTGPTGAIFRFKTSPICQDLPPSRLAHSVLGQDRDLDFL